MAHIDGRDPKSFSFENILFEKRGRRATVTIIAIWRVYGTVLQSRPIIFGEDCPISLIDPRGYDVPLGAQGHQDLFRGAPVVESDGSRRVVANDTRDRLEFLDDRALIADPHACDQDYGSDE